VRQRRTHLKDRFGREYQRTVDLNGTGAGERRLAELEIERNDPDLRPLPPAARERYLGEWRQVESRFVSDPRDAARAAERLVLRALGEQGYPDDATDDERLVSLVSVDHPEWCRGEQGLGLECSSRRQESEHESVTELHGPDRRVVANHTLVVNPAHSSFDDDALVVEWRVAVGDRLVEAARNDALDERRDCFASLDDLPGANPRDDDDVFVKHLAQALERAVTDEREPPARESLAGDLGDSGRLVDPMSIGQL
jgi:hypothetical protein